MTENPGISTMQTRERKKAMDKVLAREAMLVIGPPMCKSFSKLMNWNWKGMNPEKRERERERVVVGKVWTAPPIYKSRKGGKINKNCGTKCEKNVETCGKHLRGESLPKCPPCHYYKTNVNCCINV